MLTFIALVLATLVVFSGRVTDAYTAKGDTDG